MKEFEILNEINKTLSNNSLLGDDCAFLKDFNIYITQDTLCEGIHFDFKYTDFYKLAKKSIEVNVSDLCANLAEPKYISISISSKNISKNDIKDFYKGIEECCKKYGITVSGGDITGSKKETVISVCALGKPIKNAPKTSRKFAKVDQIVCVTKNYGSSAYALYCLKNNIKCPNRLLNTHLLPEADFSVSKKLSKLNCKELAIMDSSDGLCDALFKIAKNSAVSIDTDFSKIPYDKEIESHKNFKDLILWGGEDYGLVFCIDEKDYINIKCENIIKIGTVKPFNKDYFVKIDDLKINEKLFFQKSYNHFK